MRRLKKLVFWFIVLGLAAALGGCYYFVRVDQYQGFEEPVFVEIPRGTSSLKIGALLADAGVIRQPLLFPMSRALRPKAKPQAGEYEFTAAATPEEVFNRIARGDIYMVEIRVPEGSNVFDIARLVQQAGFGTAEEFLKVALPEEGFLFPSTYRFKRKTTVDAVCRAMRAQFDKVWTELKTPAASQRETTILASLVETEAVLDGERGRIAGVYRNRLAKGIRLECDPTVAYAAMLDRRWRGTIYKSDLASKNSYNTYQHSGLPPGPVANPGLASLKAALHPEETDELYFVAKADHSGGHVFSKDLAGHQKAVAAYRNGEQRPGKAEGQQKAAGEGVATRPKGRTHR
ncbi:endolytic transglycosylase MltG [uncultured Paludibaculum sp.]|uniref:endolytic transglycosylase MltG n=1 Tax=uncultured Paludibaculum sp. TaxID=1765020 RepID=UPI002AAB55A6|nr:endolytic transglycosylase MltG [uncultured Paludibaculum sp.]